MKKILLLLNAAAMGFLLTELLVGVIIGYPKYGVKEKVRISDHQNFQLIYYPHAEYWNVEGGNKVFKRNNLGFPGSDVQVSNDSKYILMLGDSVLEGLQIEPQKISTSIFQEKIAQHNPQFQVVNLAYSGHSPYDLWIRLSYFEQFYVPAHVILVIQDTAATRLIKHAHPLNFINLEDLGKKDISQYTKLQTFLRNHSHFFNLFAQGYKSYMTQRRIQEAENNPVNTSISNDKITDDLLVSIDQYQKKYRNKFILVSIIGTAEVNSNLEDYCDERNIRFACLPIYDEHNKIGGVGHLNEDGNKRLGNFLYEIFQKFTQE